MYQYQYSFKLREIERIENKSLGEYKNRTKIEIVETLHRKIS